MSAVRFEWQMYESVMHGILIGPYRPCPDDHHIGLCGKDFTLTREDFRRDRRTTTCTECQRVWAAWLEAAARGLRPWVERPAKKGRPRKKPVGVTEQ